MRLTRYEATTITPWLPNYRVLWQILALVKEGNSLHFVFNLELCNLCGLDGNSCEAGSSLCALGFNQLGLLKGFEALLDIMPVVPWPPILGALWTVLVCGHGGKSLSFILKLNFDTLCGLVKIFLCPSFFYLHFGDSIIRGI